MMNTDKIKSYLILNFMIGQTASGCLSQHVCRTDINLFES